jgi:hypothetical protein
MRRKVLGVLGVNLPLLAVAIACSGEDGAAGSAGASSTVRSSVEPPGEHCADGGTKLEFGRDDGSGQIDEDAISSVTYVCAEKGAEAETEALPVGDENCEQGGTRIELNDQTIYACNGAEGVPGTEGPRGDDGTTPAVVVTEEPEGTNCEEGGLSITVDGGTPTYVCNGAEGPEGNAGGQGPAGESPEVVVEQEPEGDNCALGGIRITVDGGDPVYVCDGEPDGSGGPGFVLVDADGEPVDAWIAQNVGVDYGDVYDGYVYNEATGAKCVYVTYLGQRNAGNLMLDLATGRPEPCYPNYADWHAAGVASGSWMGFNSADCTGTPYGLVGPGLLFHVDGVLYSAAGDEKAFGAGTGQSLSALSGNGACEDWSSDPAFTARAFVPADPDFIDAFDNAPYTVELAY